VKRNVNSNVEIFFNERDREREREREKERVSTLSAAEKYSELDV